jgi:hypothetical protein
VRQRRARRLFRKEWGEPFPKLQFWKTGFACQGKLEIRGFERMETGKTAGVCSKTVRFSV